MPKKDKLVQTCMNPNCQSRYVPGHYGKKQKVCPGSYTEKCIKKCPGKTCKRCAGKGKYKATCKAWYRRYWAQARKPPRGMTEAEQKQALAYAEKKDLRYWSLLVVARNSAMRKGELLGMTWADVEDGKEIRSNFPLRGQWDDKGGFKATKTDSGRIAYIFKEARAALARIRASVAKEDLVTDRIWPYTEVSTWERWVTLQKKLKIFHPDTKQPYRFHDLRHTACIRILNKKKNLRDVATLAGHKNPATSMTYTMQRPEDFVESIEG